MFWYVSHFGGTKRFDKYKYAIPPKENLRHTAQENHRMELTCPG